jgi:hypothetical protein
VKFFASHILSFSSEWQEWRDFGAHAKRKRWKTFLASEKWTAYAFFFETTRQRLNGLIKAYI